jgi:AMP-binding enzyme
LFNSAAMLEAHFGVPAAGGVLVAVNHRLASAEVGYILQHSGARYLLLDTGLEALAAPMLTTAIPADIWSACPCFIVHPGPPGDRGPSSLDWAIMSGASRWGVTVLQANAVMDAGEIWASVEFPVPACSKSSLYRAEVADAALEAVRGEPGAIIAWRDGAICRATMDGAVWIPQLRRRPAPGGPATFKLPATLALRGSLADVPHTRIVDGAGPAHLPADQLPRGRRRRLPGVLFPRRRHEHRPVPPPAGTPRPAPCG